MKERTPGDERSKPNIIVLLEKKVNTHTDCRTGAHIIQNTTMYDDNNDNTHKNWI